MIRSTTVPPDCAPSGHAAATAAACLFRGMSDPSRVAILQHLLLGPHNVTQLTSHLGLAQSTVSKHLACLKDCGLVESRPVGSILGVLVEPPRRGARRLLGGRAAARRDRGRGHDLPRLRRGGRPVSTHAARRDVRRGPGQAAAARPPRAAARRRLGLLQPDRSRHRDHCRAGRRVDRARRIRPGLDRRSQQRADHPVAVPPAASRVARAAGSAADGALVLRACCLRDHRVGPRTGRWPRTPAVPGRHRAGRRLARDHAVPVLGAAPHGQGTRLQRRRRGLDADVAVHLPVGCPARRLGPRTPPRAGRGQTRWRGLSSPAIALARGSRHGAERAIGTASRPGRPCSATPLCATAASTTDEQQVA